MEGTAEENEKMFSPRFWILCGSTVLFMASFGMVLPELPDFLEELGRPDLIGWIVGLFTVGAFFSRFLSGRIADLAGRRPVMLFGTWVTTIAGICYIGVGAMKGDAVWSGVPVAVWFFLALRLFHGLSTGFRPTGTTAYITDITPLKRRGEALGYLGVAGNAGMAGGPAIGSWLTVEYGYDAMFMASSALGLIALLMTLKLPETLKGGRSVRWGDLNVFRGPVLDWTSWPAALGLLPVAFAFGTFLTISPDFVGSLGYVYKGTFNTIIVFASISMRLLAGRASDRHGRVPLLMAGGLMLAIGMFGLSWADSKLTAALAGIVYGMSIGINMPTIMAWTADLAQPGKVALAMGTMLMSLELGIGFGAVFSGYWFQGDVAAISMLYATAGMLGLIGFLVLIVLKRRIPDPRADALRQQKQS
ncbi:MAG: MFS transporter [Bacteroidetes bacterium]|nr:MFS transporter [Bacteroidota bacterium]MDA1335300.1 MFS transporter [Bacteroidota bacterium]